MRSCSCRRRRAAPSAAWAAIASAAFLAASTAHAGVYKCAGDNSTFVYQEDPCPQGKELRNFDLDPPNLSVIPYAPSPSPSPAPARAAPDAGKPSKQASERRDRMPGKVTGDANERKFIRVGMTDAEVRARIGQPDMTAGGGRGNQSRWSYLPNPDDPDTITTITFSGDRVSDVSRKLVKR